MEKYIDMHTHSSASDGELSPSLLAKHAYDEGLSAVAICDHDTGSGIEEFMSAADRLGIEGIPSIEISANFKAEMHILGYYIDYTLPAFKEACERLRAFRRQRNEKTQKLLAENGISVSVSEAEKFASGDVCGRLHFAMAMVEKGYAASVKEAFSLYLGSGKCAYSSGQLYSPKEAIEFILSCGGYPTLAHPKFMGLDDDETFSTLARLKSYGLYGVECLYNAQDERYQKFIKASADKLSLAITGGSDYHGKNKPHVSIGRVYGDKKIPYEILENFRKGFSAKSKKNIVF